MTGPELAQLRRALGLTQLQLAIRLGVDPMTVSRWERGARPVPPFLELALRQIGTGEPVK